MKRFGIGLKLRDTATEKSVMRQRMPSNFGGGKHRVLQV